MARQAGKWTSRAMQIRAFLDSGLDVIRVPVEEGKAYICANNSLQAAIRTNPYFANRVEVFNRSGKVYLARKDTP